MNAQCLTLPYGEELIEFQLERRVRKTLSISVRPDLGVEVVAPVDAPLERIYEKVRRRAPWIRKQLSFFAQFQPRMPERRYVSGETHLYLGRQYKLKVIPHIQQHVKLHRGQLVVQSLKPRQAENTKALVEDWYAQRARLKFHERLEICLSRFPQSEAFEPSSLMIRRLSRRWGSMTPARTLVLNRSLIRASVDSIDYVITHELCHIPFGHHGADFYKLLDRVMPDWEKRKLKLERQLA